MDHAESTATDERDDQKVLARGMRTHLLGFALRAAHPVLLALVTTRYGAERWGAYAVALGAAWIALRVIVFGDDRALLWWIPRVPKGPTGAAAVFRRVAFRSLMGAGIVLSAALVVDRTDVALFALAAAPMPLTECLLMAIAGRGKLGPSVLVRDVVTPFSFLAFALCFEALPYGLALAFFVSNVLACAVAGAAFIRGAGPMGGEVDAEFERYARAIGVAELANTGSRRLDALLLGLLAPLHVAGVYDIVKQFANTLTGLRAGFEPIVTSVISKGSESRARVRSAARRASRATAAITLPVAAVFFLFAPELLALFGEDFAAGAGAVRVLAAFGAVSGPLLVYEAVSRGLGRGRLVLALGLLTVGTQTLALLVLAAFGALSLIAVATVFSVGTLMQGAAHFAAFRAIERRPKAPRQSFAYGTRSAIALPATRA